MRLRDSIQELRELGLQGTLFRAGWEIKTRTGLVRLHWPGPNREGGHTPGTWPDGTQWTARLPFSDPISVADSMRGRIPPENLEWLSSVAADSLRGNILCFGRWKGNYGNPVNWQINPTNGQVWKPAIHWATALKGDTEIGDIKLTWEVARFPHAYHLARGAAFDPSKKEEFSQGLLAQIEDFIEANPVGSGIHWASGQEIAFRLLSWIFSLDVLMIRSDTGGRAARIIAKSLLEGSGHIEENIDYARFSVYNNHLLSEALALYAAGILLPQAPESGRWRRLGLEILQEGAERQFYPDGGYIQQSHNYHRVALQDLLFAWILARAHGDQPPQSWGQAMERSLQFLLTHQNPADGSLPNYGANDGSLPMILSTCDFSDFRPLLQAVSIAVRAKRIYDAGPWDETAAWLFGPRALDQPLQKPAYFSVSFAQTGYHVLRGRSAGSFSSFRCGTIRDRFSQIDMLHVDVWWRGQNVIADAGSFLYNGPEKWHRHFMGTACHNTIMVDGRDQMLHYRRFKCLYWTEARILDFQERGSYAFVTGEHYGFRRYPGQCVHRRSVLFVKDDLWVVVDRVLGEGEHNLRLHWLGGDFSYQTDSGNAHLVMNTGAGPFSVTVLDENGRYLAGEVVSGREGSPRGWLSRYYGEKIAVPSLVVERKELLPVTMISILCSGVPKVMVSDGHWGICAERISTNFLVRDGLFDSIRISDANQG
ncbi:MAG: alginate lyase family protein [Thermodesulfobacteriota bacterium]